LFEGIQAKEFDEFTITYAGSFYEGWIEPYSFIDGVNRYVSRYGEDIQARFYGDWNEEYQAYVDDHGLDDVVKYEGRLPHEEIVPVLKGFRPPAIRRWGRPSQPSEHLVKDVGLHRCTFPVLAIADSAFRVHDFVDEYQIGISVTPENPDAIAEVIRSVQTGGIRVHTRRKRVLGLHQAQNARVLAEAMNEISV